MHGPMADDAASCLTSHSWLHACIYIMHIDNIDEKPQMAALGRDLDHECVHACN